MFVFLMSKGSDGILSTAPLLFIFFMYFEAEKRERPGSGVREAKSAHDPCASVQGDEEDAEEIRPHHNRH